MRQLLKANPKLASIYYIFDGWRRRRRLRRGILSTTSGARHAQLPLSASIGYIERVYSDYLAYARRQTFQGHIVEIGPGDNFGVALLMLRNGATSVTAIDKYSSYRDAEQQAEIYAALSQRHDMADLFFGVPSEATIRNFTYMPGMSAERYFSSPDRPYHVVMSRAVLEHLDAPLMALDAMWRNLQPGGLLVHRVDLRDHGMFAGAHPLTFLTIGRRLYDVMARDTGRPNRVLLPQYRMFIADRGWTARLGVTRLVGVKEEFPNLPWSELPAVARRAALAAVQAIRPKLAAPFAALPDEDLAVAGFVLVAEKD